MAMSTPRTEPLKKKPVLGKVLSNPDMRGRMFKAQGSTTPPPVKPRNRTPPSGPQQWQQTKKTELAERKPPPPIPRRFGVNTAAPTRYDNTNSGPRSEPFPMDLTRTRFDHLNISPNSSPYLNKSDPSKFSALRSKIAGKNEKPTPLGRSGPPSADQRPNGNTNGPRQLGDVIGGFRPGAPYPMIHSHSQPQLNLGPQKSNSSVLHEWGRQERLGTLKWPQMAQERDGFAPLVQLDCGWPLELGSRTISREERETRHIESAIPYYAKYLAELSKSKDKERRLIHYFVSGKVPGIVSIDTKGEILPPPASLLSVSGMAGVASRGIAKGHITGYTVLFHSQKGDYRLIIEESSEGSRNERKFNARWIRSLRKFIKRFNPFRTTIDKRTNTFQVGCTLLQSWTRAKRRRNVCKRPRTLR
eukprot:TRINITY_DN8785_c0_g1_i2.p1 TRINITY_DN8785_c0_g1~~TRINITY_DN8785_c0_g1_i2.p1  ORF type:complete len:416 (-),score=38.88 TRINITY_DN8785_c0_g1_i2:4-1251(-)